jgi:hypothetical protein
LRPVPEITPADAYREILRFWFSPHAAFIETTLQPSEFPSFQFSDPNVVVTACYFTEDSALELRLLNFSSENSDCQVRVPAILTEKNTAVVKSLGAILQDLPMLNGEIRVELHDWEFKTVRFY